MRESNGLGDAIGGLLKQRGQTIAVAESSVSGKHGARHCERPSRPVSARVWR